MNGMEMLEKMEMISPEYVQEADQPFQTSKRSSRGKIIMLYGSGMAAGFVMLMISASLLVLNGNMTAEEPGTIDGWAATAFSGGSLPLILSIAVIALFAFLLIRRKQRD